MDNTNLTSAVQKLHDEHKSKLDELEKKFKDSKDELTEMIQKHPLTSVAIALGVGFIIGKLFSNRK